MHALPDATCAACGADALLQFLHQERVPTSSCLLLDSAADAIAHPTGSLRLAVCQACGFIRNVDFDPGQPTYSTAYEETQGFSPRFREFARDLALRWIDRHDLRGRHVLEIGCGKGEFLALLCELGGNRGTGIDPAYVPGRLDSPAMSRMTFHQRFYTGADPIDTDVVVCRHTLEHVGDVAAFVRAIRQGIGDADVPVLFELPDVGRVLDETAFWDLYYEHCSYFTPGSLARLFRQEGFEVTALELDFDDQYILLDARPVDGRGASALPGEDDPSAVVDLAAAFAERYDRDLARRRDDLDAVTSGGGHAVIWGAGSKGVAWLVGLGVTDAIRYAVDINPHKQGRYMAGTGQEIIAPERLRELRPDVVYLMNPVYADEVGAMLADLGVVTDLRMA